MANAVGSGWSLTGNAGTDTAINFFGTTDNRDIIIKRNNIRYGYYGVNSTGLGLYSLKYGNTGSNNTSIGNYSMFALTTGISNTAVGYSALSYLTTGTNNVGIGQGANRTTTGTENVGVGYASLSSLTIGGHNVAVGSAAGGVLTTGSKNTLIGDSATTSTSSTDSSIAIGFEASAATRQLAFSPHVTEIKATGITGASNSGYVLTTNGSGIATFQAASTSSPSGNYGNLQINRNSVFSTPASDSLKFSSATLAVKGALTTTGAITATGNVSGNLGLFTSGVRTGNNTNMYWNSGPVILGNTNDITIKNAAATAGANVSIGASAAVASAILDVNSTTKGALLPRMTGSEAEAISSPATGLIIYCTNGNGSVITSVGLWNYNGTAWVTAGAKEYTVYRATLTQTGTSAPTITLLENTTGSTVTAQYDGVGMYSLQFTGTPLTANKTFIQMGSIHGLAGNIPILTYYRTSTSSIFINTATLGAGDDNDLLGETAIEIRIYP